MEHTDDWLDDDFVQPLHQRNKLRVNGFAPGDRVAVVNCELRGAYGRVISSGTGCNPTRCRENCRIVRVELSHIPDGVEIIFGRASLRLDSSTGDYEWCSPYRFRVDELVHAD